MQIQKIINEIDEILAKIRDASENEDGTDYNEAFQENANNCVVMLLKMQHHLEAARMMACDIAETLAEVLEEIEEQPIWGEDIDDNEKE